jgi:hypothetical protein
MRESIFVRTLSDDERQASQAGLRSSDAFVLRRCPILLASDRDENAYQIARSLGCNPQRRCATPSTALTKRVYKGRLQNDPQGPTPSIGLSTPKEPSACARYCTQAPGTSANRPACGRVDLAAEVSFEEGLSQKRVSGETIRATLARLGVRWRRAKRWITSPDPEYQRKKGVAIG